MDELNCMLFILVNTEGHFLMKKKYRFLICFLLLLVINIWSQKPIKKYVFVNIKESVSEIGVRSIIQDQYGLIWIGTDGSGLNRFDGVDYKTYTSKIKDDTSLNSNIIYCSYIDVKNRLWFGTDAGLNLYDRKNDRFKRITLNEFKSNEEVSIRSLKGDQKGNLYVGTFEHGLFQINLETLKVAEIVCEEYPLTINSIEVDATGKVYAATNKGLKEIDSKTNILKSSLFKIKNEVREIKDPLQYLLIDNNTLWVGTSNNGLYKIKQVDNRNYQQFDIAHFLISENRLLSIIKLPDGTLMCSRENNGLFHIDVNGHVLNHYLSRRTNESSILSNSIWSLYLDRNKRIWLGYYNAGIGVYDQLYDKFEEIESLGDNLNSLKNTAVTAIVEDNYDKLWIAMDGGGIDVFDSKLNKSTHISSSENKTYSGLTNDYIVSLFVDSKQNIWAGSWANGLFFLKNGSKNFVKYTTKNSNLKSNNILSIAEELDGTIWFASWGKGLHSYNPQSQKITYHNSEPFLKKGITNSFGRKVLIAKNGDLWLTTTNKGLFKIKKSKENTFSIVSMASKMYEASDSDVSTNHVLSLFESSDGSLWIGTRGSGLCKYNLETDSFRWYDERNGLEAINVLGIIEDLKGDIWLSSNSGISKFDINNNTFTRFTKNDGLLSNDFYINSTYRDSQGILYFGNYKGINYFNPSKISTNNIESSLYLTGFKLFNRLVTLNEKDTPLKNVIGETSSITLNHTQSVFTIEYTGINFTRPEKNRYAYYLEGFEEDWNYVGSLRSATYTNLDGGKYTFKLKSANSDGVWNKEPLILKIKVLPPWWKTNLALFIYIFFFLLGIYFMYRLAQRRLRIKQEANFEEIRRLQEKDLNEKKFQFFTNISHEFRTPLTLIMSPINDIIKDESLKLPDGIKKKHTIIYKNTRRLYRLINELLDFRKLELNKARVRALEFNLVDFTKDIISYFKEEALSIGIEVSLDTEATNIPFWCDKSMMEKVIFNILSNAMKVTPRGGVINIDLEATDALYLLPLVSETEPVKVVKIIISDTGLGIEKEDIEKIFERFYQSKKLNKTYYGSTGIGLEVVKEFVQLHKGEVKVESNVGDGTSFTIVLPVGNTHFSADEIVLATTEVQTQNEWIEPLYIGAKKESEIRSTESLQKYTLLIVEDNLDLKEYLKEEIGSDYKVFIASNGKEGLTLAKEILPDVILTDVMMPEMDGIDFSKQIKSNVSTSHIPILMLTSKTTIEDRIKGIEVGADAYMAKPFDMRLLRLRLLQLITSRQLIFNKYFSSISEMPVGIKTSSLEKEFIEKVLNHINENIGNPDLNVGILADNLNLSRSQFYRKIKALTNQTANEFLRNIRLQKAKQILETGSTNISDVCYKTGFSSPSYFSKCFKSYFGMSPTEVKITKP